ncbi:phasin family protein [Hyphomicrobium sp.]|uniref:phasin family protein n=1 Tax=Hyphomicrobium sp. TaxID=82 RepID=UPI002D77728D|nr:phasin family protein [Hyphomicrobium sp.]HET6387931.1 phasin family protein [Hyphomicrobium sp.]
MSDRQQYSEPKVTPDAAPGITIFPLLATWNPVAGELGTWNSDARHASEAITQSWLRLVGDRMAKDAAFPQQLANCKTIDDVYQVYAKFWQQAANDYGKGFTAIADAVWQAARGPLAPFSSSKRQ